MNKEDTAALFVDRTGWPKGPWDNEPDRVQWKTRSGLPGLVVRNKGSGNLCGYAAVTEGHPCFGRDYSSGYEDGADGEPDYDRPLPNPVEELSVHGGITYGEKCAGHICHVPDPGEPDNVHWLGFDCHHVGDLAPGTLAYGLGGTYRDLLYVTEEVENLADQLAAMVRR